MALSTTPEKAGYGTIDDTETQIFVSSSNGKCMSFRIKVAGDSAASLLVNVPRLHGADVWTRLDAGDIDVYRDSTLSGLDQLDEVNIKSASGSLDATLSWSVVASGAK